jgi:hypothetical protein
MAKGVTTAAHKTSDPMALHNAENLISEAA